MCRVLLGGFKLSELKLGELLDTPPPGLDEAMAISKVFPTCSSFHECVSVLWGEKLVASPAGLPSECSIFNTQF